MNYIRGSGEVCNSREMDQPEEAVCLLGHMQGNVGTKPLRLGFELNDTTPPSKARQGLSKVPCNASGVSKLKREESHSAG